MAKARTDFEKDDEVAGPPPSYDETVHKDPAENHPDLEPVAKCRDRSKSIWIHFPHIELVFLLYAVQGSLATQVEVLRHGVDRFFYAAAIALVSTHHESMDELSRLKCSLNCPLLIHRTSSSSLSAPLPEPGLALAALLFGHEDVPSVGPPLSIHFHLYLGAVLFSP